MSARKQNRPLSARLAVLGEAVASASRRAREAELEARRVEVDIARLKDVTLDAYAAGDDAKAAKASHEPRSSSGAG